MIDHLTYGSGTADIDTLRAVGDAEWRHVLSDEDVRRRLADAGVEPTDIPAERAFDIRAGSSGFDPSSADIVIAVGGWITGVLGETAKEILLDLWRTHVKPRIADRLGDDAFGPEKDRT